MTTHRVVEDLPVIQKAAVTLSLEELELDSEASKKKWNRSYGEARVTANRAAAFTGTTRKGKGQGLFDGDDDVNDENDEGYLLAEQGAFSLPRLCFSCVVASARVKVVLSRDCQWRFLRI